VLLASGVGNNPEALAKMRRADVGGCEATPERIIPAVGQVAENGGHPPPKQGCHVFHDDEAGSKLANDSSVFAPQARTFPVEAGALASVGEVLAGESAADGVDAQSIAGKNVG